MELKNPILITMGSNKFYQSYGKLFLDVGRFYILKWKWENKLIFKSFLKGSYGALLEYATGTKPTVIGKPAKEYFQLAMNTFQMNPDETLMIGDDIE